jgi:hypothetical protein
MMDDATKTGYIKVCLPPSMASAQAWHAWLKTGCKSQVAKHRKLLSLPTVKSSRSEQPQ